MGIEPTRSAWKADVLPLNYARRAAQQSLPLRRASRAEWWGEQDSNLRRLSHQIYSLTPLAARESPPGVARAGPGQGRSRVERRATMRRYQRRARGPRSRLIVFPSQLYREQPGRGRVASGAWSPVGFRRPPPVLRDAASWSQRWDSNPQPPDYKSGALPIELRWLGQVAPGRVRASPPGLRARHVREAGRRCNGRVRFFASGPRSGPGGLDPLVGPRAASPPARLGGPSHRPPPIAPLPHRRPSSPPGRGPLPSGPRGGRRSRGGRRPQPASPRGIHPGARPGLDPGRSRRSCPPTLPPGLPEAMLPPHATDLLRPGAPGGP